MQNLIQYLLIVLEQPFCQIGLFGQLHSFDPDGVITMRSGFRNRRFHQYTDPTPKNAGEAVTRSIAPPLVPCYDGALQHFTLPEGEGSLPGRSRVRPSRQEGEA